MCESPGLAALLTTLNANKDLPELEVEQLDETVRKVRLSTFLINYLKARSSPSASMSRSFGVCRSKKAPRLSQ